MPKKIIISPAKYQRITVNSSDNVTFLFRRQQLSESEKKNISDFLNNFNPNDLKCNSLQLKFNEIPKQNGTWLMKEMQQHSGWCDAKWDEVHFISSTFDISKLTNIQKITHTRLKSKRAVDVIRHIANDKKIPCEKVQSEHSRSYPGYIVTLGIEKYIAKPKQVKTLRIARESFEDGGITEENIKSEILKIFEKYPGIEQITYKNKLREKYRDLLERIFNVHRPAAPISSNSSFGTLTTSSSTESFNSEDVDNSPVSNSSSTTLTTSSSTEYFSPEPEHFDNAAPSPTTLGKRSHSKEFTNPAGTGYSLFGSPHGSPSHKRQCTTVSSATMLEAHAILFHSPLSSPIHVEEEYYNSFTNCY